MRPRATHHQAWTLIWWHLICGTQLSILLARFALVAYGVTLSEAAIFHFGLQPVTYASIAALISGSVPIIYLVFLWFRGSPHRHHGLPARTWRHIWRGIWPYLISTIPQVFTITLLIVLEVFTCTSCRRKQPRVALGASLATLLPSAILLAGREILWRKVHSQCVKPVSPLQYGQCPEEDVSSPSDGLNQVFVRQQASLQLCVSTTEVTAESIPVHPRPLDLVGILLLPGKDQLTDHRRKILDVVPTLSE